MPAPPKQFPPELIPAGSSNWNPLSWVKSALGSAGKIASDIKNWVTKVVREAVDTIDKELRLGLNLAHKDLNDVWGGVEKLAREVERITDAAGGRIAKVFDSVEHDITTAVKAAVSGLTRAGSIIWDHADNLFHDAERDAKADVSWAEKHVIDPAVHDLEHGLTDAEKAAKAAVNDLYHDFVLKALHDADKAWAKAESIGTWLDHSGYDAVKLVESCWDFLESVANHPANAAKKAITEWEKDLSVKGAQSTAEKYEPLGAGIVKDMEDLF